MAIELPVISSIAVVQGASIVAVVYVVSKYMDMRKAVQSIGGQPGYRILLSPASLLGNLVPQMRGVSIGNAAEMKHKYEPFEEAGTDVISAVSAWPNARVMLFLADVSTIKEVAASRSRFPKPVYMYEVLSLFGRNLVVSEGEEWKKMRKISAPAFSDRNNRMVWDETVKIILEMFTDLWGDKSEITTDHVVDITLPIALFVIGVAGFGRQISWKDDDVIPAGHKMSFKHSLHVVSTEVFLKLVTPKFATGMTERLRTIRTAFIELEAYMIEMIHARKDAESKAERHDLFTNLLDANSEEDLLEGAAGLSQNELVGNIFIFLLAGHETTAHTLAFTFALLALHQEEQEKLYKHIKTVIPGDEIPTYDDMPRFTQSMAVFNETLRLFPPVGAIPKMSAEDTVLTTTDAEGNKTTIPVPKGAEISFNVPAVHHNPKYWKDPHSYNPDRFNSDWPRDAFLPFSTGARACIGRKFFETEGIAILTILVSRYKIEVKPDPEFASETFEERKTRILNWKAGLTTTPVKVPLVFKRR